MGRARGTSRSPSSTWPPSTRTWRAARRSRPWRLAFDAPPDLPALRHVLLGINAHVNYDLPQALLAVITDDDFADPSLMDRRRRDHERIDGVLAGRVAAEDAELAARSARSLLDRALQPLNRIASKRFLREARLKVWHNTTELQAARLAGPAAYDARLARAGGAQRRSDRRPARAGPGAAAAGRRGLRRGAAAARRDVTASGESRRPVTRPRSLRGRRPRGTPTRPASARSPTSSGQVRARPLIISSRARTAATSISTSITTSTWSISRSERPARVEPRRRPPRRRGRRRPRPPGRSAASAATATGR